ncbi:MAG: RT0821/Lpp0805 family surface protein [Alphaproteobacteria bacterium]
MKIWKSVPVVLIALALAACESTGGQKQTVGTVLGGVGGAVLGSTIGKGGGKLVAVAAGTMLGALLGSEIGRSLDKADQAHANRTAQQSLESAPTGKPSRWVNPDSGHSGSVTPTRTFKSARGQNCREFEQTVTIDGRTEVAYGTACRQADGTWKIVNA